jgi:NAD(P)H dehydrogenase (quinone)
MPGPGAGSRMCENVALVTVAVIGATGDLGARIVNGLRARGVDVRGIARKPADGCVVADLSDPASLTEAFTGVQRLFLQSSATREQIALEVQAIAAAVPAGVEHVVKLSNIPIDGLDSGLHGNHRVIERRLASAPIRSTVLQPSFFANVIDKQRDLIAKGKLVLPTGAGKIAWIDPADIAAIAVEALLRDDVLGAHVLTGPEALDGDEVGERLGVTRLDPPRDQWRDAAVKQGLDPWLADSTVHLYDAVARGALATVSDEVPRLLGRPAHQVFVRDRPL